MTTTPLILDRYVAEVATFARHDPKDVGVFVDLVAGCDFVSSDEFGFSVQIDPDELHVQVDFPSNTAPQVASDMLQDLVIAGSMAQEIEAAEQGVDASIDERFRKLVERFGECEETRERINFIGSSVIEVVEPELNVVLDEELTEISRIGDDTQTNPWVGGTAMVMAATTGFTSEKSGGKGSTELDSSQRDDLRIAGSMMQRKMLAHFGDSEYTFKP